MEIHLVCQDFCFPYLDIVSTLRIIFHPVDALTLLFKTDRLWEQGDFSCDYMCSIKLICLYVFSQHEKKL